MRGLTYACSNCSFFVFLLFRIDPLWIAYQVFGFSSTTTKRFFSEHVSIKISYCGSKVIILKMERSCKFVNLCGLRAESFLAIWLPQYKFREEKCASKYLPSRLHLFFCVSGYIVFFLADVLKSTRPNARAHVCMFKLFLFCIFAFSNRSTLDCISSF